MHIQPKPIQAIIGSCFQNDGWKAPASGLWRTTRRLTLSVVMITSAASTMVTTGSILVAGNLLTVAPSAAACPGVIANGEMLTTTQILTAQGEDCTVEAGGTIDLGNAVDNGILLGGVGGHSVTNNGMITGFSFAGIRLVSSGNTFTNNGWIIGFGDGLSGIVDNGVNSGNRVYNNNVIRITGVDGRGMSGLHDNTFRNTGIIEIIDANGGNTFNQMGQGIGFDSRNSVFNDGQILVTGNAYTAGVYAFAGDDNTLYNSGLIRATPFDNKATIPNAPESKYEPYAIFWDSYASQCIEESSACITEPKAVDPRGDLFHTGSNNKVVLLPGSVVIGRVAFGASSEFAGLNFEQISDLNTVRNDHTLEVRNGQSIVWTFDKQTVFGDFMFLPGIVDAHGAPVFVDEGNYKIAVIDPTLFSVTDEVIIDVVDGVNGGVQDRMLGVRQRDGSGGLSHGTQGWLHAFGSYREQKGSSPSVDTNIATGGIVIGVDGVTDNGLTVGGFIGGSISSVTHQYATQDEDIDGYFGGAYAGIQNKHFVLDAVISGGVTAHDRRRVTNNNVIVETETIAGDARSATGLQTGTADYKGYFVAPELAISGSRPVSENVTLIPSASLRYIGYFLDGFSESGSADNLSVENRNIHMVRSRAQLAAVVDIDGTAGNAQLVPRAGAEFRYVNGNNVSASALGLPTISFNPGGKDQIFSGFAGVDLLNAINDRVTFTAGVEGLMSDDSSYLISGYVDLSIGF